VCANIVERASLSGSGKGLSGWFPLTEAAVSYDHPFHVDLEHAVNIDFTNEASGLEARVAVELSLESARALSRALLVALERAENYENQ
jgi:hypothetical protein